jgi:N-acetylneuraminic acid mutarotase
MFATVEAYNPANNSWVRKAPMPAPRYGQAVAVVNGILYAAGGWGGSTGRVADLWAYNPTADVWSLKSPMRTARMSLAIAEVNGTLYAIGGELNGNSVVGTVEAYNPATDTWTTRASMPTPRLGLAAATVNGIIYAVGGATESGFESTHSFLSTVEAYDPATDAWTTTRPMPTPRSFLGTGVINDTLYAAGGTVSNTGLTTMEAFTITLPTIAVDIEVKPGSINPRSQGKVLAAVLTTDTFDATSVDPSTVRLGATAAPPVRAALQDSNGDGRIDLILHFNTPDAGLECGDTSLSLTGMTFSGQPIEGSDSIQTVGCQPGRR